MMKLVIDVSLHKRLILVNIKLKKKVTELFLKIFLCQYIVNGYKTERMCDEAIADCLAALKFIHGWFFTSKILEKTDNALYSNDDTLFYNEDFDKVNIYC